MKGLAIVSKKRGFVNQAATTLVIPPELIKLLIYHRKKIEKLTFPYPFAILLNPLPKVKTGRIQALLRDTRAVLRAMKLTVSYSLYEFVI